MENGKKAEGVRMNEMNENIIKVIKGIQTNMELLYNSIETQHEVIVANKKEIQKMKIQIKKLEEES